MAQSLRREALKAFKSLHRARLQVFEGDDHALNLTRLKINEEYKKCKEIVDTEAIKELIAHSRAVEQELVATIIQAREVKPGKYEIRLRNKVVKLDNVPFKECG